MKSIRRRILRLACTAILLAAGGAKGQTEVDWESIARESFGFLALQHGFRYLTEEGTRHPHASFFNGYVNSLNNLHGWADGDPFLVDYVGHPMQGAVSGFIFAQNDRGFRDVQFGKNKHYWKSRLRAAAYSWLYSEQFELGPVSEASIGNTQAFFPQQGFVDQVTTPTIGLAWMIAEDSLDKYVIRRVESRTQNPWVRLLVRGGLNPSRSLANMLSLQPPWHRTNRSGLWESPGMLPSHTISESRAPASLQKPVSSLDFAATARAELYLGPHSRGACVGGGGTAAFRITSNWQFVADVAGCKMTRFGEKLSGDALTYMIGPRWTANARHRWTAHSQLLIGGRTLTHEEMDPAQKARLEQMLAEKGVQFDYPDHIRYTRNAESTGLAVAMQGGIDVAVNPAIQLQVADIGYMHSWHAAVDGIAYTHALQFAGGLVLRFGTW